MLERMDSKAALGRVAPSRRTARGSTARRRSLRTQLGRRSSSQAPAPMGSQRGSPEWSRLESMRAASRLRSARPMTTTGRSLPTEGSSSKATHTHTISPGSGRPLRCGRYAQRTRPAYARAPPAAGAGEPVEPDVLSTTGRAGVALVAHDLAGLQARGAHVLTLRGLADERADPLNVRVPATLRASVRVRDAVPEAWALAADVAVGSHGALLHDS